MRRFTPLPKTLPVAGRCCPLFSSPRPYSTIHETVHASKNRGSQTEAAPSASSQNGPSSFESEFGFDDWSEVNPVEKTVNTAVGKLPISPLLDPSWRKARLRKKIKIPPAKAQYNRFRRRTAENVYAQFLAAPVRYCHNTKAHLPRSLLQSFGLARHPETDQVWWIPGDFEQDPGDAARKTGEEDEEESSATDADGIVTSNKVPPEYPAAGETHESMLADDVQLEATKSRRLPALPTDAVLQERPTLQTATTETGKVAAEEAAGSQQESITTRNGKFFAPAYMLARQDLMLEFLEKRSKFSSGYMRFAINPSIGKLCKQATWRADMHEVVRDQMRRQIVGELAYLWRLNVEKGRDYLIKVNGQEDFQQDWNRFCCLSFDEGEREPFEILEAANTAARAVSVFDLPRLLGPENVQDLVSQVSLFQDATFVVLKGQRTLNLRKRLWRLEGFMADYGRFSHNPALGIRSGCQTGHSALHV